MSGIGRRGLGIGVVWAAAWAAGAGSLAPAALAQSGGGGAIFTCTNASGKRLTSDRPIAECLDREQRVLNRDGSLRTMLPPSLTSDERAALEESERRKLQERASRQEAIRRDRNLLARYPTEDAHRKAREAALDDVRAGIRASEQRLADLEKDRKPLLEEAEFYKGKPLPAKLKRQIESIDVTATAQRELVGNQKAELGRVTALFDAELVHLKKLWGGAEPGSLPSPVPAAAAVKTEASSAKKP
ncbi:hypothetical protein [uncultured Methylibium sp.]|uniref:hypothetical protein n=1 Tax=uncultured Methylibium sp. TaxID=381093 RepID=UPI0025E2B9A7|nr:hypothetical protein [uncultured Methylibium sp.]